MWIEEINELMRRDNADELDSVMSKFCVTPLSSDSGRLSREMNAIYADELSY